MLDGQQARLTQAALETLAVVAYKQPVSRARVSAIRGVNVDGVMRTLLTRGLVEEAGQRRRARRHALPHHRLLPGADRGHLARRAARARALPARHGGPRGRPGRGRGRPAAPVDGARSSSGRRRPGTDRGAPRERPPATAGDRRGPGPAAEAARPVGGRLAAQVRGADAGRRGRGRRRGGHPARHQGRPAHRGDPGLGQAAAADRRRTSTSCSTSRAAWSRRCRTPRGGAPSPTWSPTGPERLFHVGRLDTDTSGLLLLTNDGDFAQRMAHPSYEVDKTYVAEVEGGVTRRPSSGCSTGVTLDDGPVDGLGGQAWSRRRGHAQDRTVVELVIHEGRNRIVRRLLDARRPPGAAADPHRDRPRRPRAAARRARCAT